MNPKTPALTSRPNAFLSAVIAACVVAASCSRAAVERSGQDASSVADEAHRFHSVADAYCDARSPAEDRRPIPNASCCDTAMGIDPEAGFALTSPLVPFVFDNSVTATEGRIRTVDRTTGPVGAGAKMGVMRMDGTTVLSPSWDYIGWFCQGLAPVCEGCTRDCSGRVDCEHYSIEGGRWGYIDLEGELVIPLRFDHAATFDGGTGLVRDQGRLGHVSPDGQVEWHDTRAEGARSPSD